RACRADEGRDRARFVSGDVIDDRIEGQRLIAETEVAAADGWDQRHLVAVAELAVALRVLLVDRIEQAVRLRAEAESRPDLVDARDLVQLARAPARALAQPGEQLDRDAHGRNYGDVLLPRASSRAREVVSMRHNRLHL